MSLEFSPYDQRHYLTVDVREGYRRWSARYDEVMSDELDLRLLSTLRTVRWNVERAIDLACGTGRIGSWLAGQRAQRIEGVDLTPEMIDRARARGVYELLACEDIRSTSLAGGADLVINVLSVEHLPELPPFYAEVARLSRPGASAVIVGYHPHFLLNGIPTHFDEGDGSVAIENTIHLFSDHVRVATAAGFVLRELEERVVDDGWIARTPGMRRYLGRPVTFAMVWQLAPRAAPSIAQQA
jgi:SAM-dependent methyltransferase